MLVSGNCDLLLLGWCYWRGTIGPVKIHYFLAVLALAAWVAA